MDNILQDSQSIISDITENNDNNTTISFEIEIKVNEITSKLNSELNKLNLDSLKDKAKDLGVSGISKIKKPDLIQILENEFIKLLPILKEKKSNDLKNICKQYGIKGVAGYKKDYLVCQILEYHSSILKFKLDDMVLAKFGPQYPNPTKATLSLFKIYLPKVLGFLLTSIFSKSLTSCIKSGRVYL